MPNRFAFRVFCELKYCTTTENWDTIENITDYMNLNETSKNV